MESAFGAVAASSGCIGWDDLGEGNDGPTGLTVDAVSIVYCDRGVVVTVLGVVDMDLHDIDMDLPVDMEDMEDMLSSRCCDHDVSLVVDEYSECGSGAAAAALADGG